MIYLDNASTTKPSEAAIRAASDAFENFGNPSSLHNLGMAAEKIVTGSRRKISAAIGVPAKNLYFTSGGTESNNTAIFGAAKALGKRGRHIITSKIEHPSVYEPFLSLENEGFDVDFIKVMRNGRIDIDDFESRLREDTILVSCMHVNNETGVIQPVDKLKEIMRKKSPNAFLHVDAVQSFCKIPVRPKEWGVDIMSISGHKIGGIKGTGGLYITGSKIRPYIMGGGQQANMRSGTENVPGIAAFGAAAESFGMGDTVKMRNYLRDRIKNEIENVVFNGDNEYNCGYILNVSFLGIKAEILLHSLEKHGIYVSTGSACSSNKPMPSRTLTEMGASDKETTGAVRFSLNADITKEDTDFCIEKLKEELSVIRRYMR
ncbi:MAG: cysteine desulfurase [Oscillospiraceae bacterium]|nr:cysteine desulfurase [Oscillospiraceae bacterium]